MAVYAAHLTRARGEAPSVFQVAAERALASEVKPALRRLVEYVASGRAGLQWLERWFDEIYLLLDVALQHYYLKHYAASFSESFYGLMRVSVAAAAGGGGAAGAGGDEWGGARLDARMERLSLALLAVAPYLRDRAAPALQRWRQRRDDRLLGKDKWDWARSASVRAAAAAAAALGAWRLAQLAAYAAGAAHSPAPALCALRLTLRAQPPPPPPPPPRWRWADLLAGHVGFPELAPLLLRAAQYAAFGVQLLAYCAALAPAAALPPPPPPPPPPQREAAGRAANRCPLCRGPWRAPAALPVSGYVFCYTCIARSLRAAPHCPVTRCPARADQLLRLYGTQ